MEEPILRIKANRSISWTR